MLKRLLRKRWSEPVVGALRILLEIVGAIVVIVAFFGLQGLAVTNFFRSSFVNTIQFLGLARTPYVVWLLASILFILLFIVWYRLRFVAGTFYDKFDQGLVNWEYAGEGWTVQRGEIGYELNITNSSDGAITNFGFGWDSYEYSFECKLLNRNVGWIVRAAIIKH